MEYRFADRINDVPRSFIREILKVSLDPDIVSFAGGLPNRAYFPVQQVAAAASEVFERLNGDALQYSNSEGVKSLREMIAERYRKRDGLDVSPDTILITNGSQQALDLIGKVLLNEDDAVLIEEPGYLGAIQALSLYRPRFRPVTMMPDGIDVAQLEKEAGSTRPAMLYTVPTFQNPSGVTYSSSIRQQVAEIARKQGFIIVEDDPYGELRFQGKPKKQLFSYLPEQTVLLGSFSKTVAPGLRIGWLVAPPAIYEKLLVAKQAADLHTTSINQYILESYLRANDLDAHIQTIIRAYGNQCRSMLESARRHLPEEVQLWEPDGGMFLWGKLPAGWDSMKLFEFAVKEQVVYVPGAPFYSNAKGATSLRLSFSCASSDEIEQGMQRLGRAVSAYREACRL